MKFDIPKEAASIIKVIGVGGGGSNAVNHMYQLGINGVDFMVCNTDNQALDQSPVPTKFQLGASLTDGRGAGSIPEVGRNAAIENIDDIKSILDNNTRMVFITAGMGGGTGTGAAPVIAQTAKEMGILTVGIVTIPFMFEGRKRKLQAEAGIEQMRQNVDTLLVICNDRLREMYGNLNLSEAFAQADQVLSTAAKGIAEIITVTGAINVDFEDVSTVMKDSGVAIMGSATAEGEDRATKAVAHALASPLLNDNNIEGARYVLLNITYGDQEIQMDEVAEITDYIQEEAGSTADVIWGHGKDDSLGDKVCVTIIATGFKGKPDTGHSDSTPQRNVRKLEEDVPTSLTQPLASNQLVQEEPTKEIVIPEPEPFIKPTKEEPIESVEEERPPLDFGASQKTFEFDISGSTVKESNADEDITPVDESCINPSESDEETPFVIKPGPSGDDNTLEQQQKGERIGKLKEMSMKLRGAGALSDMENEPAYKRRQVILDDTPHSSEIEVSRFTLSEDEGLDGEKRTGLKDNNSFLHDNVD